MRISHTHKFIFFANPKTGSKSVRDMLDPYSDIRDIDYRDITDENPFYSHIRPIEMKEIFEKKGWDYDSYYSFTFIRNPWKRMVSLYQMINSYKVLKVSFSRWLKSTAVDGKGGGGKDFQRWRKYGTYSIQNFAGDGDKLLVNQVIRLEDINEEVPKLIKKLNLPIEEDFKIIKSNTRDQRDSKPVKHYTEYYNQELIDLVAERYKYDIEEFNYSFK